MAREGREQKGCFEAIPRKSEGENLLFKGVFTSTCSFLTQANMLRWTLEHGQPPEQMLKCLQTPRAREAEGYWLLLGEQQASCWTYTHALGGERKKPGPNKDAFLHHVCVCHLLPHPEHCCEREGGPAGPFSWLTCSHGQGQLSAVQISPKQLHQWVRV